MKKVCLFLLFAVMTVNIAACSTSNIDVLYSVPIDNLEDVMQFSSNIIKGELLSLERFDDYLGVYQFKVVKDYTNNTEEIINVYDSYNKSFYDKGETYFLFLVRNENALYPHPIYTTPYKELIAKEGNPPKIKFDGSTLDFSSEDFENMIQNNIENDNVASADAIQQIKKWRLMDTADLAKTIKHADSIMKIEILDERPVNRYASSYDVEHIEILKGSVECSELINLEPGLDIGSQYYVLMQKAPNAIDDYDIVLFSKFYTAIDAQSELGEQLLENLKQ